MVVGWVVAWLLFLFPETGFNQKVIACIELRKPLIHLNNIKN
jgi:hypothetical protein